MAEDGDCTVVTSQACGRSDDLFKKEQLSTYGLRAFDHLDLQIKNTQISHPKICKLYLKDLSTSSTSGMCITNKKNSDVCAQDLCRSHNPDETAKEKR